MNNKNILHFLKRATALMLVLTIFAAIPKYRRCEEPELSSATQNHSLIFPHQNGILNFD